MVILHSPYSKQEAIDILNEQIDRPPGLLRYFLSMKARYVGTSRVCGVMVDGTFELRNRSDPFFSLRAKGEIFEGKEGTTIKIIWLKPNAISLGNPFFNRNNLDKETILDFLKIWIKATETEDDKAR